MRLLKVTTLQELRKKPTPETNFNSLLEKDRPHEQRFLPSTSARIG